MTLRHHQALDRHVTGAAMVRIAKRLGLRVKGGVIEAGDDEMTLVSDLAVYGRVAGATRAIDRYSRAVNSPDSRAVTGSLDTFDKDLLEALRRSWFSVFRFTSRHPIAGWSVDDRLLDRTGGLGRGVACSTGCAEPGRWPAVILLSRRLLSAW